MDPFIAELSLTADTEAASDASMDFMPDPAEISGGLDRDIIRRKAKDHALEEDPEDNAPDEYATSDSFEFTETGIKNVDSGEDDGEGIAILVGLLLPALADQTSDGDTLALDVDGSVGGEAREPDPELDVLSWVF